MHHYLWQVHSCSVLREILRICSSFVKGVWFIAEVTRSGLLFFSPFRIVASLWLHEEQGLFCQEKWHLKLHWCGVYCADKFWQGIVWSNIYCSAKYCPLHHQWVPHDSCYVKFCCSKIHGAHGKICCRGNFIVVGLADNKLNLWESAGWTRSKGALLQVDSHSIIASSSSCHIMMWMISPQLDTKHKLWYRMWSRGAERMWLFASFQRWVRGKKKHAVGAISSTEKSVSLMIVHKL